MQGMRTSIDLQFFDLALGFLFDEIFLTLDMSRSEGWLMNRELIEDICRLLLWILLMTRGIQIGKGPLGRLLDGSLDMESCCTGITGCLSTQRRRLACRGCG
jgi:hypothetical protein